MFRGFIALGQSGEREVTFMMTETGKAEAKCLDKFAIKML